MKKVIKLNESDVERLVKKIIREEEDGSDMSSGIQKKTDKIVDLPVFSQLSKQLKSKNVNEQVEFFMTLLGQFDLKGNFGMMLKKAMSAKGLI
jgi:hypothetical protein|tara:strand:- start:812 stop:1090 length:279 start_codon:yes stop_codon:yes gene_type:complete